MTILFDDDGSQLVISPPMLPVLAQVTGPLGTYPPSAPVINPAPAYAGAIPILTSYTPQPPEIVVPPVPGDPIPATGPRNPLVSVKIDGVYPDQSWGKAWQRVQSDAGSGQVTVPLTDPTATATFDDLMQFYVGPRLAQTAIIEKRDRTEVTTEEEMGETITFSGRGVAAELDSILVYPDLGAEHPDRLAPPTQTDRHFNWTASSGIDMTTWAYAVETAPNYGVKAPDPDPQRFIRPEGWPTPFSDWIWDRSAVGSVPPGDCYFRAEWGPTQSGPYQIWCAGSDDMQVWLDGTQIIDTTGYYTGKPEMVEVELGYHYHYIAARVTNRVNRGGFNCAVLQVLPNGTLRHQHPTVSTSDRWRCVGYPTSPPGMTVGKAIRLVLEEYKFRSDPVPIPWGLRFTDTIDTNGNPWPVVSDITIPVGISLLAMLEQLSETHIDWCVPPGLKNGTLRQLEAYRIGEMGWTRAAPVGLTEVSVLQDGGG